MHTIGFALKREINKRPHLRYAIVTLSTVME